MSFHSRFPLGVGLLAIAGFPALRGQSPGAPSLGAAASFAVLGGPAVMSSGATIVTGNLGVSPGNTVAGFPPGVVKVGDTFRNDSTARQAQRDAVAAYDDLAGRPCTETIDGPSLSGTRGPGVYCFTSPSVQLTGTVTLTLDATNDPNAVWIFRIGAALTTNTESSVRVAEGGHESNVFWQVGGAANLGSHSVFVGNLLALTDISLSSAVSMSGRALARGAVALDNSNVSLCCDPILIATTLPDGFTGSPYHGQFMASGGIGLYTFALLAGQLPPGLGPITGGVLSGTPSATGSYNFTVAATDAHGCTGIRSYTVSIACPKIVVSPSALPPVPTIPYQLPPATACIPTVQTFSASGGTAPYTFSLSAGQPDGPPPSVLTSNVLTWTPAKSGNYTFTVTATDSLGCSGSQLYEVVVACEPIPISPLAHPYGQVCVPYNEAIVPSGCDPPYILSLMSGMLPPGLTGPTPGNAITGIPRKAGIYHFTIKATSGGDPACFTTRDYTIVITCPMITISPSVLPATCPTPNPNPNDCVQLTASCAIGSPQFEVTAGALPPGLVLSPDGMLCGTPSAAGTFNWMVTVTDSESGCTGSASYTLQVTGLTITPATLPTASPGTPYNEIVTASGGTAPYTFVVSGTLPPGLTFMQTTPTTATISGTPTTVSCFPFTVTVTDANGCFGSIDYTICVAVGGAVLSGWGVVMLFMLLVAGGWVMIRKGGG